MAVKKLHIKPIVSVIIIALVLALSVSAFFVIKNAEKGKSEIENIYEENAELLENALDEDIIPQNITTSVGKNGMGKTNILDAIYMLSFCKSAFINQESLLIRHEETWSMVQGVYSGLQDDETTVSCGLKKGTKKQIGRAHV